MSSRHSEFDNLYLDHRGAYSRPNTSQILWERATQPSVVISAIILLVTILYNLYGSSEEPGELLNSIASSFWDGLVYVTPARLVFTLDSLANPQLSSQQMISSTATSTHASKSAAMRRLLGIDRTGGLMASVFKARSRAISATGNALGLKLEECRPPGLGNRDNSCFQNSILQGLASLQTLPDYLTTCLQVSSAQDEKEDESGKAVTQILRTVLSDLNDPLNNGRTLWTPSGLKFMSTWTQQDAQEYYSKILDDIDKGAARALKMLKRGSGFESDSNKEDASASQHSDDSGYQSLTSSSKATDALAFRNPLEGLLAQRVACVQCGHSDGLSMIPFNCLTLSLGLEQTQHDLYERLDAYSQLEAIEGVQCPKCTLIKAQRLLSKLIERMREGGTPEAQLAEPRKRLEAVELALEEDDFEEKTLVDKCKITQGKVDTTKTKQIVIARPPQSLAIHMNRSVFDPNTFNLIKNSAPVQFPTTLDLGPWCLGSAVSPVGMTSLAGAELNKDGEEWLLNPKASMVAGDMRPSRLSGPIYELRAAVTHYGRHDNGHYVCYRKYPRTEPPITHSADEKSAKNCDDVEDEGVELSDREKIGGEEVRESKQWDWWRLSDHNVSKMSEDALPDLASGVFMLFYDCIDPSMVLQEEDSEDAPEIGEKTAEDIQSEHTNGSAIGPVGSEHPSTETWKPAVRESSPAPPAEVEPPQEASAESTASPKSEDKNSYASPKV